jgi:tungstate transport system ATP-binding protein
MAFIETIDLGQKREKRDILKKVSIRVERGEVRALIGPTGAGKTTLLRLIDLLDEPAEGKILIGGTDVYAAEKSKLEIRRRIAFVLQKPVVFNMSVFNNISYGLKWRGMESRLIREKVDNLLEVVGLTEYRNRNAKTLSGGEMQRVAIARAIATDPEILLLDEPSANLDPVASAKIEELIKGIIKRETMTVIVATHDMAQGQRLADKITVLVNGEVVQTGAPRDIFSSPTNRQVAEFVGMDNILDGNIIACDGETALIDINGTVIEAVADCEIGQEVSACWRPEDVTLAFEKMSSSARNSLEGRISRTLYGGPLCRVEVDCGFPVAALVTKRSAEEMKLEKGMRVYATIKAVNVHVIKRN